MTVRECYEKMGANYDGVLSRLGNEMLIRKFVINFSRIRASRISQLQLKKVMQKVLFVRHIH